MVMIIHVGERKFHVTLAAGSKVPRKKVPESERMVQEAKIPVNKSSNHGTFAPGS